MHLINKCDWNLEVPYVSDLQIQNELTKYGMGVHKEVESSDDESVASEGWRPSLPYVATFPTSLSGPETSHTIPPASGYVTHPTGLLPPFDTSNMREVGRTLSGDHVLQFPKPAAEGTSIDSVTARPSTPRLPWQLLYEPPALRLEGASALTGVSDDEPENAHSNLTNNWLPADPATWASSGPSTTESRAISNGRIERINYDAHTCLWQANSAVANLPKLVFSNFIAPTASLPVSDVPMDAVDAQEQEVKEEEREEGQIDEVTQLLGPCLRSRADHVSIPAVIRTAVPL
ncbi:hypothetical protein B0H13DRAFT_2389556 [Mycena leptocephala]|nr:hypothetical protein B0H13DRAFT_2389556 [Mycena leptocephala]